MNMHCFGFRLRFALTKTLLRVVLYNNKLLQHYLFKKESLYFNTMDLDFKELSSDENIVSRLTQFNKAVDQIQEVLKFAENPEMYDQLSNENKIKYNLLMSFSLNSLFWMYLRAEGVDPTKHQIKAENERLKQSMARAKQIHDRNTIRPRINRDAAQRFIRNGLWVPVPRADDSVNEQNTPEIDENWDG